MSKQGSKQGNNAIQKNQLHLAAMYTGKAMQWGKSNSTYFLILLLHRYCTPFLTALTLRYTKHNYPSWYTPI